MVSLIVERLVAGDKATDLDQIGRFLFNFGNPNISNRNLMYELAGDFT